MRVKTQLMKVATEAALSLETSEMYSHTIGPGPNSKTQTNAMTMMSSRFEFFYIVAYHITTKVMMHPTWLISIRVFLPAIPRRTTPPMVATILAVFTIAEPWLAEKVPASANMVEE